MFLRVVNKATVTAILQTVDLLVHQGHDLLRRETNIGIRSASQLGHFVIRSFRDQIVYPIIESKLNR